MPPRRPCVSPRPLLRGDSQVRQTHPPPPPPHYLPLRSVRLSRCLAANPHRLAAENSALMISEFPWVRGHRNRQASLGPLPTRPRGGARLCSHLWAQPGKSPLGGSLSVRRTTARGCRTGSALRSPKPPSPPTGLRARGSPLPTPPEDKDSLQSESTGGILYHVNMIPNERLICHACYILLDRKRVHPQDSRAGDHA